MRVRKNAGDCVGERVCVCVCSFTQLPILSPAGVVEETLRKYTRFMQYIVNEDLQRVYEWRPLLNVSQMKCR